MIHFSSLQSLGEAPPRSLSPSKPAAATPNGLPPSADQPSPLTPAGGGGDFKPPTSKTPRTPLTPLSTEITLDPADYKYTVELVEQQQQQQPPAGDSGATDGRMEVRGPQLARQKGVFTPKKLKLFLRSALSRPSEKHPFFVKVQCTCTCMLLSVCGGGVCCGVSWYIGCVI